MTEPRGEDIQTADREYAAHPGFDHDQVVTDIVRLANAGAALAYALYHAPAAWWTNTTAPVPEPVKVAYMKACRAYGIGRS